MGCLIDTRQRILLKAPHLETISGSSVSFRTDLRMPLNTFLFSFTPALSGSGTQSPDNVRPFIYYRNITITENGTSHSVTFPYNMYAGALNCKTGIFTASHWVYTTDRLTSASAITSISTLGTYTRFWFYASTYQRKAGTVPICDTLPSAPSAGYSGYSTQECKIGASDNYNRSHWCIMPTSLVGSTADSIYTYLTENPMTVLNEVDATLDFDVGAIEMITVREENAISCTADGIFNISYWTN